MCFLQKLHKNKLWKNADTRIVRYACRLKMFGITLPFKARFIIKGVQPLELLLVQISTVTR